MSTRAEIVTALSAAIKVGAAFADSDLSILLCLNGLPSSATDVGQLWDEIEQEEQWSKAPPSAAPALSWSALVEGISAAVVAGARFSDSDMAGMLKANALPWRLADVASLRLAVKAATYPKGGEALRGACLVAVHVRHYVVQKQEGITPVLVRAVRDLDRSAAQLRDAVDALVRSRPKTPKGGRR
ncbi:MAG: hypothetical protein MUP86_02920 [Dehalococcoidia bacterium]|nr:hypothetical protein [Dehalococcoidia bacterium]